VSKQVSEIASIATKDVSRKNELTTCIECKNTEIVFDPIMGEKVCTSCGIVLAERLQELESGSPDTFNNSIGFSSPGLPSSLMHPDKGLSTVISFSKIDGNGITLNSQQIGNMHRIIRWNKISAINSSHHRNLKAAFSVLMRIRDKLMLSQPVAEKAAYYYRKCLDLNLIKGRSIKGFIVASVYIACREMGMVRSIQEISKTADTNDVFAGKCYRFLSRRLNIRIPNIDARAFLSRIANNAGISEKSLRKATDMMSAVMNDPVSHGKDPNSMAAGVLYAVCLAQGEEVRQVQIAQAANLSVVTIRKRLQDVRKVFPKIPDRPGKLLPAVK